MLEYELTIHNQFTGKAFELSQAATKITLSLQRKRTAGKLEFSYLGNISDIEEGNIVTFKVDSVPIFYGYLFKRSIDSKKTVNVLAYDQRRYLKAKGSYNFKNISAEQIIRQLAGEFKLKTGDLCNTGYRIPSLLCESTSIYDICEQAAEKASLAKDKVFVFDDDYGKLVLRCSDDMKQKLVIGEKGLLCDYTFSSDIENTYNQVKIARPNEKTGGADIFMHKSDPEISKWGILQYYQTVNENANDAQVNELAKNILNAMNHTTQSLSLSTIGIVGVRAGHLIQVEIRHLNMYRYLLCESVKHTFENLKHKMDLEMRVY